MFAFFQCVAEAVVENGVRGLAEMVPGGAFAYNVADSAWKKYRERKKDAALRNDIQQLAAASFDEAKQAAAEAVREALSPASGASDADRLALEMYLSQVPAAVRQSLKRPDDPTGTTVPAAFALNSPDDVLKILPARPPRFAPGYPLPGKPGWALADLLGSGGFGEVWLAKHPRMQSLSGAVKFYHGRQARDLHHESALIDRVMAAGPHPGIVPVLDVHLEGEAPWVMFEYVPGGDLADVIRSWQGKPAAQRVSQAIQALQMLAEAVGHFHRLPTPVVHRDLKPSNILRDRTRKSLRITDFGIGAVTARAALDEEARGTSTRGGRLLSYLRGSYTPLYSSPQQREGITDPDPRDDVHALGVIAYQMLTGFLHQGIGSDFADDLRDVGTPEELIALIGKCVAQMPKRRPRDAAEVRERLQAISRERSVSVVPPRPQPPPSKPTLSAEPVRPVTAVPVPLPPPAAPKPAPPPVVPVQPSITSSQAKRRGDDYSYPFRRLLIPHPVIDGIIAHARETFPHMCCGLLGGLIDGEAGRVEQQFRVRNDSPNPLMEFTTNPSDMLSASKAMKPIGATSTQVLAIYCSYPTGKPSPSRKSIERNSWGVNVVHLIVGLGGTEPEIRAWWLSNDGYAETVWEGV